MAEKKKVPLPVDRPLSRAYLREFAGWSTAYPPGVSDPTSLRLMENVQINREGSCRVRPGLRYLNYLNVPEPDNDVPGTADTTVDVVGSHEPFYMGDGSKAYLYAVRETDGTIGFRVLMSTELGQRAVSLSDAGFELLTTPASLNFSSGTTYVKYLQIDNRIFALSNNGEAMRLFFVGAEKKIRVLASIERPDWNAEDKLDVVHPEADWIENEPTIRVNSIKNPSFETNADDWFKGSAPGNLLATQTATLRTDAQARTGTYSWRITSQPERRNEIKQPLHDVSTLGITGWEAGRSTLISAQGNSLRIRVQNDAPDDRGFAMSTRCDVTGGHSYKVAFDLTAQNQMKNIGVMIRYFNASGNQIGDDDYITNALGLGTNRKVSPSFTVPDGCVQIRVCPFGKFDAGPGLSTFDIKDIFCGDTADTGGTNALDGSDGADYYWTGTTNDSASVYHPPKDIGVSVEFPVTDDTWTVSMYLRAGSTTKNGRVDLRPLDSEGTIITNSAGSTTSVTSASWARVSHTLNLTAAATKLRATVFFPTVARGDVYYIDNALAEIAGSAGTYFDGDTPNVSLTQYTWLGDPHASKSQEAVYPAPTDIPDPETPTANTLISSTKADNDYAFGFFYAFSNEVGESAASQITVVRAQRQWTMWEWESPNGSGEPSGDGTKDPLLCADQLVASIPAEVFAAAIAAGAIKWSLYMMTWSDQDPMPVTAIRIDERELDTSSTHELDGWLRVTPAQAELNAEQTIVPSRSTLFNASDPSRGGQGLVAADRMVLVFDPTDQAVIKWSSNQQGAYSDFSPSRGGGYKTLTSGNLMIPASVKLWQNPQSADTITILCLGTDGTSTGYYMAPAQVASQSEAVNIMAFEETTATPGTTSPYGCEVLNNALYHPLDEHLMKSNAANYNINHTTMTDLIQNRWRELFNKHHIVSSQLDNRLYFLVHNPAGEPLEDNCWGNEIWVLDAAQKAGSWSRWLVQGQSLRKIEQGGRVMMSVVHPSGIYYFDESASTDHYVDDEGNIVERNIPWMIETNTQGANRAHDAWSNLQQVDIQVGNFQGQMEFGIRGKDVNGTDFEKRKVISDNNEPGTEPWDVEDYFLVRRVMKEWFFFASSVTTDDEVQHSSGQLNLIQYRYTPSTVNTGYEFGEVETFEYGKPTANVFNGVPVQMIDTGRP